MKRYGYKEQEVGSAYARYVELRFAITLCAGLSMVFSKALSGNMYAEMYIFFWFALNVISYLSEIWPKLHVYPVFLVCLSVIALCLMYDEEIFYTSERVKGSWDRIYYLDVVGRNTFIVYQGFLAFVCVLYIYNKARRKS